MNLKTRLELPTPKNQIRNIFPWIRGKLHCLWSFFLTEKYSCQMMERVFAEKTFRFSLLFQLKSGYTNVPSRSLFVSSFSYLDILHQGLFPFSDLLSQNFINDLPWFPLLLELAISFIFMPIPLLTPHISLSMCKSTTWTFASCFLWFSSIKRSRSVILL